MDVLLVSDHVQNILFGSNGATHTQRIVPRLSPATVDDRMLRSENDQKLASLLFFGRRDKSKKQSLSTIDQIKKDLAKFWVSDRLDFRGWQTNFVCRFTREKIERHNVPPRRSARPPPYLPS